MIAAKFLANDRIRFRLTICGNGRLLNDLKSQARGLEIEQFVHFVGWVPNARVGELLNQSDIFVLPSRSEGMPNALLQAMACGLPIVTTNVSSIPEIIQDGINGYLAPPNDPVALYRSLKKLALHPTFARAMGKRNREKVVTNHNVMSAWRRIAKILNVES
jgi:glycosyltransferase involved in cell wall biosynthesis